MRTRIALPLLAVLAVALPVLFAGVAQAHGARLGAANRPGGGAVFSAQFPLAPVTAPVIA